MTRQRTRLSLRQSRKREWARPPIMVRELPTSSIADAGEESGDVVLAGYAYTWGDKAQLWPGESESFRRGAFAGKTEDRDAKFTGDHQGLPVASVPGTFEWGEDDKGLRFKVRLDPSNPRAMEIISGVRRGDLDKVSLEFSMYEDDALSEYSRDGSGGWHEEIVRVGKLWGLSAVAHPAYRGTELTLAEERQVASKRKRETPEQPAEQQDTDVTSAPPQPAADVEATPARGAVTTTTTVTTRTEVPPVPHGTDEVDDVREDPEKKENAPEDRMPEDDERAEDPELMEDPPEEERGDELPAVPHGTDAVDDVRESPEDPELMEDPPEERPCTDYMEDAPPDERTEQPPVPHSTDAVDDVREAPEDPELMEDPPEEERTLAMLASARDSTPEDVARHVFGY